MALYTKYTLAELRSACQRELLDPNAQYWPTAELDKYINEWQQLLQSEFEFVWGSSTATFGLSTSGGSLWGNVLWGTGVFMGTGGTSTNTITLTNITTDMMRLDAIYYGTSSDSFYRLMPRDPLDLDAISREWRNDDSATPLVSYQNDAASVAFWPPPSTSGTYIFEYPKLLTLSSSTDSMSIPAWTKYTCVPYVVSRALARFGPNQNLPRATRYRRRYDRLRAWMRKTYDAYLPEGSVMLRPGRRFAGQILSPRRVARYQ